eukprot:3941673-Rhodomonas_salina.2
MVEGLLCLRAFEFRVQVGVEFRRSGISFRIVGSRIRVLGPGFQYFSLRYREVGEGADLIQTIAEPVVAAYATSVSDNA